MNINADTYGNIVATLKNLLDRKVITKAQIVRDTGLGSEWIGYFANGDIADAGWSKVYKIHKWLSDRDYYNVSSSKNSVDSDAV